MHLEFRPPCSFQKNLNNDLVHSRNITYFNINTASYQRRGVGIYLVFIYFFLYFMLKVPTDKKKKHE